MGIKTPIDIVRSGGVFKYVRFDTDEVRFAQISGFGPDHAQMVSGDERPVSAGTVSTYSDKRVSMIGYGSQTLDIRHPLADDNDHILSALGEGWAFK